MLERLAQKHAGQRLRDILPFILCGGAGTRLWPLSREAFPKQFHRISGSETLFQQTCRRLSGPLFGDGFVLSNQRYRFIAAEQLEAIGADKTTLVLEPAGRNTAPAACVAALIAARSNPDALVLLAPSDHCIPDAAGFARAVEAGRELARQGELVVFGVEPDCPHTGYGYIETGGGAHGGASRVKRFIEKPSLEAAESYFAEGGFLWNAGIFLFRPAVLLDLIERLAPEILSACRQSLESASEDLGFVRLGEAYAKAPNISFDYAVAEKASNLSCVPLTTPWSDVGSWAALWQLMEKDADGNAVRVEGHGHVLLEGTRNSYAYSDHSCVALVGVEDMVVIAMEDAVLVASKEQLESVREIVANLKGNGHYQALEHNRIYRPWGWYQGLNKGERYQVKCIMVKPGGVLSLQSHFHRSEHWVVVTGTVEVRRGEETELLSENESTYIPIGKPHRLSNPGKIPAFLIEVQSGPYLAEDDIVRFEDVYQRQSSE